MLIRLHLHIRTRLLQRCSRPTIEAFSCFCQKWAIFTNLWPLPVGDREKVNGQRHISGMWAIQPTLSQRLKMRISGRYAAHQKGTPKPPIFHVFQNFTPLRGRKFKFSHETIRPNAEPDFLTAKAHV